MKGLTLAEIYENPGFLGGKPLATRKAYGWDFEGEGSLIENAAEQEAIAFIKRLRGEGKSLRQIATLLDERGLKPKRGERWRHSTVIRILARPA
jgi:hypothetical protein